jgi:hypothetical protein
MRGPASCYEPVSKDFFLCAPIVNDRYCGCDGWGEQRSPPIIRPCVCVCVWVWVFVCVCRWLGGWCGALGWESNAALPLSRRCPSTHPSTTSGAPERDEVLCLCKGRLSCAWFVEMFGFGFVRCLFRGPPPRRRWSSNPSGKCSYERPTRGTVCATMRSMCGADAGCLAINYQSLPAPHRGTSLVKKRHSLLQNEEPA